ncbi:MAG TPA: symmetrical bis(5'-nucleosyl)-tetraphosphatase [Candidatus Acidoferrum sp.]|nr:symmetrical bis(5'-nucleosyl)-tetraphosphatase [Candidatus Acidoferrum sp.]
MAIFAIGDLQGCYSPFRRLLDQIRFDAGTDRLWLVGDIINRGPDSLATLRFVKGLGNAALMVLGNHDLHLLMVAEGCAGLRRNDTLDDILAAPDRQELLDWLRWREILHVEGNQVLVHAGLLPSWSVSKASSLARIVEDNLRGTNFQQFCVNMYGDQPDRWSDALEGYEQLRVIINAMTRMRLCTPDGKMDFSHKGPAKDAPPGYLPWFEVPGRASSEATIICGHWSALGLRLQENLIALDTGCLWGGSLTAVRLEDRKVFQVACAAREGTRRWQ